MINGRVYYSAAWLGAIPFEPEPVRIGPEPALGGDKPKEEQMDVTVTVRSRRAESAREEARVRPPLGLSDEAQMIHRVLSSL